VGYFLTAIFDSFISSFLDIRALLTFEYAIRLPSGIWFTGGFSLSKWMSNASAVFSGDVQFLHGPQFLSYLVHFSATFQLMVMDFFLRHTYPLIASFLRHCYTNGCISPSYLHDWSHFTALFPLIHLFLRSSDIN
jgi:hypothetical protein